MSKLRDDLNGETLWGLPKDISEELIRAYDLTLFRWLGFWLFMIIMCLGFLVGGFWVWPFLENLANQNAFENATNIGGLMYDVNFGWGLLIGLFVWIFLTNALVTLFVRVMPMPIKAAFFMGLSIGNDDAGYKHDENIKTVMNRADKPSNAKELINRLSEMNYTKSLKILLPIAFFIIFICLRETQAYTIYSAEGYYKSGFFSKESRTWDEARSVELGCNQTDDGGSLVYKVYFLDKSLRLEDKNPVRGTYWLDNLEVIDSRLEAAGAEFKRWRWLKRNPLHPKCLRGFYGELGLEGKGRIDKLLRIDEF